MFSFLQILSEVPEACRHLSILRRRCNRNVKGDPSEGRRCKEYVRELLETLRSDLLRREQQACCEQLEHRCEAITYSKGSLLLEIRGRTAPELPAALNWIGPSLNQAAVASLLCGDWFLAIHAGNFFAKAFIPKSSNHTANVVSLGIEPSRVCISCWHWRRQFCLEDEGHVCFECPGYDTIRAMLHRDLTDDTRT